MRKVNVLVMRCNEKTENFHLYRDLNLGPLANLDHIIVSCYQHS